MSEFCIYCGNPRVSGKSCCGEIHFQEMGEVQTQIEIDTCPICNKKSDSVTGPKEPRQYYCLDHRHLAVRRYPHQYK